MPSDISEAFPLKYHKFGGCTMKQMRVAQAEIRFEPTQNINVLSTTFFSGTKILSVHVSTVGNHHLLQVSYLFPSEYYSGYDAVASVNLQFVIAKYGCAEVKCNRRQYLGDIKVNDVSYAVFYQKV